MSERKKFYLTTAIPYGNGAPHIGHAYEIIAADVLARFYRSSGYDLRFLAGMDEHGQKMQQTAKKNNQSPQQLADHTAGLFQSMHRNLNIEYDDFIRTTEPRHQQAVQQLWKKMVASGDIYISKYSGWYSVRDEAYFGENELVTASDGQKLAPSGAPVEWVEEDSFFFRLSAYQQRLLDHYAAQPDFIMPETRRNEIISFVKAGLTDLSVSRTTFNWGVPVPDASGHVMYVWVDALSNYLTALGWPDDAKGLAAHYWPADCHLIGKDIVRFHAVYWPAFLMAAGLPLPKQVYGHGFIFNRGEKMSKSVGNVITPESLVSEFGADALRYFLLREVAFGQDGSYSTEAIISRLNSDLANDLGNLAQRTLAQVQRNCAAAVPAANAYSETDQALFALCQQTIKHYDANMRELAFNKALDAVWLLISECNRYIDTAAPWTLKKTDPVRMATVLYVLCEVIRQVAILLLPFMPVSINKLLDQLQVPMAERTFAALSVPLVAGTPLPAPTGVFPRYQVASDA